MITTFIRKILIRTGIDTIVNMEKKLYYIEEGRKNKEVILFIHSNLLGSWIWEKQRKQFNNYHCIYLDLIEHGKTQIDMNFSIKNCVELIKNLITNDLKGKKVHLVGIAIGGVIIVDLLYKYPNIIETAIISGVNVKNEVVDEITNRNNVVDFNKRGGGDVICETTVNKEDQMDIEDINEIAIKIENDENKRIEELLNGMKECRISILDKKHPNFIIRGFLAEYGIGKEYFDRLKLSVNVDNFFKITEEHLKYRVPNKINNFPNLLILYGTKEYPKVVDSAKIIQNHFPRSQVFSIYRAIHLWNIINYKLFNEIIFEFIKDKAMKNKDFIEKEYLF
ncbi:MAG: alpha/beta hydrolase [Methanobrevibacter sp.]|nr:alpha/beta hydrolase [Candidatus Methanovirga aequatorialis]